jgi:hypothetical protein
MKYVWAVARWMWKRIMFGHQLSCPPLGKHGKSTRFIPILCGVEHARTESILETGGKHTHTHTHTLKLNVFTVTSIYICALHHWLTSSHKSSNLTSGADGYGLTSVQYKSSSNAIGIRLMNLVQSGELHSAQRKRLLRSVGQMFACVCMCVCVVCACVLPAWACSGAKTASPAKPKVKFRLLLLGR